MFEAHGVHVDGFVLEVALNTEIAAAHNERVRALWHFVAVGSKVEHQIFSRNLVHVLFGVVTQSVEE